MFAIQCVLSLSVTFLLRNSLHCTGNFLTVSEGGGSTCTRVCYLYYYYGYRWEILLTMLLGSMLPQYIALSISFVSSTKIVCPFVGLHCGCVAPPCENMCVRLLGKNVGASPPRWPF